MRIIYLLLLIFCFSNSFGQIVNIENKRIYADTSGWGGSIDGSFSAIQNKELLLGAGFRTRAQYRTRNNFLLLITDVAYTASKIKTYNNTGMAHLRYAHRISGPWKWEVYAQSQYNQLLSQKLRALTGAGIRWKFADTTKIKAFLGTSTFIEYEELVRPQIYQHDWRFSNYVSWFISPSKNINFSGSLYYQPLWKDFSDFRVALQTNVTINLIKKIDLKFEVNLMHDSKPPLDVNPLNFLSTFGFSLRLD